MSLVERRPTHARATDAISLAGVDELVWLTGVSNPPWLRGLVSGLALTQVVNRGVRCPNWDEFDGSPATRVSPRTKGKKLVEFRRV